MAEEFDTVIMELIVNAGDARNMAIEAVRLARDGKWEEADQRMKDCEAALIAAHSSQTDLIQGELNGKPVPVTLLMVHAQDHLMNALTVKDLSKELIAIMKKEKI